MGLDEGIAKAHEQVPILALRRDAFPSTGIAAFVDAGSIFGLSLPTTSLKHHSKKSLSGSGKVGFAWNVKNAESTSSQVFILLKSGSTMRRSVYDAIS